MIFGNLFVIFVLLKSRELRNTRVAIYKVSIALSDLLHGCLAPFIILNQADEHRIIQFVLAWYSYFGFWILTTSVSICTLTAMGLDRLYAVMYPLQIRTSDSKQKVLSTVFSIWVFSSTISVTSAYFIATSNKLGRYVSASGTVLVPEKLKAAYVAFLMIGLSLTWITSIVLYFSIKKQARTFSSISAESGRVSQSNRDNTVAVTLFLMVGAFTASLLPITIYIAIPKPAPIKCELQYYDGAAAVDKYPGWLRRLEASVWLIFMTNGLWNCIIYSFRDAGFRNSAKSIFCPCKSTQNLSNSPSRRQETRTTTAMNCVIE